MSAPTVAVTCKASDNGGNPIAGAIFRAQLNKTEVGQGGQGYIAPELVEVVAGADGIAILNLWPNALGSKGSLYRVVAFNPDSKLTFLDVTVSVPNSACRLDEIVTATPPPALDAAQQAILSAQSYLAQASEQAGIAGEQARIATDKASEAADNALALAASVASIDHQFAQLAQSLIAMQALALNPYAFN